MSDLAFEGKCIEDAVEAHARGFVNRNRMQIHDLAEQIAHVAEGHHDLDYTLLFGLINTMTWLVEDEQIRA
jgi:hypothetical protein